MIPSPRQFLSDKRGASTLMFGLIAVPLLGAVGVMSDYSSAADRRTHLQVALDTTALSLARKQSGKTDAQLQTEGNAMVRALFGGRADALLTSVTVTRSGTTLRIDAAGSIKARFSGLVGASGRTAIAATTSTSWGARKLEIVLVLDNTGSMGSAGKLAALKTAAQNFITKMEEVATEPGKVKIGIVPFNTTVKVGTGYATASWLTKNYIPANQRASWDGCIMDRNQPYDVDDTAPIPGTLSTLYPARLCPSASLAIVKPLSEDFDALRSHIASFVATGNTNVTIGVAWGQVLLSQGAPFTGAAADDTPELDKVMIVLTDGENTQNRFTSNAASIDARTTLACASAKADNIKVYTIRVIEGNAALLRGCATRPDMYHEISTASQLDPVFQAIANSIKNLRLTQ